MQKNRNLDGILTWKPGLNCKLAGFWVSVQPTRLSWQCFNPLSPPQVLSSTCPQCFLMKSFTQTREAAGRRSERDDWRPTALKTKKHRGDEFVGVASCSLGSAVSQRLHRRVDQWQNLSPCTGSLQHAALTCWSLTSQEEVVGVAKEPPGPSANSPSGGRNQRIRGSGWFTSPFKSVPTWKAQFLKQMFPATWLDELATFREEEAELLAWGLPGSA